MQEIDTVRVPFELWDVENAQQLNIAAYQTLGTAKPGGRIWTMDSLMVVDSVFVAGDTMLVTSWVYGYKLNTDFQFIPGYTSYSSENTLHYTEDTGQMGCEINWDKATSCFNTGYL